jgi:outer membrane protein assembly factor BamE (lipoprotein component of BamABCDE complex)
MTRRKSLLLLVLPAVFLLIGAGVWATWPRPSAITPENAARIRAGMTVAEVEAILGGPARDEAPPEVARMYQMIQSVRPDLEWSSDQVGVWVYLDADGRVRESHAIPAPAGPHGVIPVLRRWLRI